jgi:hypothetical protein
MSSYVATIIAALIGAGIGSIGAEILKDRLRREAEKRNEQLQREAEIRRAQEKLVQRYLLQLQDAIESLWYRLDNVKNRGGQAVMGSSYYEVSTLYALGRVLAYERILVLDGVYPQLEDVYPDLGRFLKARLQNMDSQLRERQFYRYNRLALAESSMEREEDHLRTSTYMHFRQHYERPNSLVKVSLEPAKHFIATLGGPEVAGLLDELRCTAKRLESVTRIPTTLT